VIKTANDLFIRWRALYVA